MDITTIIGGIIVGLLAMFGITKLKNNKASKEYKDALEIIQSIDVDKAKNRAAMAIRENERIVAKKKLETELKREVTDEEIVDYLNDRYKHS